MDIKPNKLAHLVIAAHRSRRGETGKKRGEAGHTKNRSGEKRGRPKSKAGRSGEGQKQKRGETGRSGGDRGEGGKLTKQVSSRKTKKIYKKSTKSIDFGEKTIKNHKYVKKKLKE